MQPGLDYFIEKLDPLHQPNKFSIGPDEDLRPLKSFIQGNALEYQAANVAVTYVAALPPAEPKARPRVIGYITLTCSEIELHDTYALDDCEHANRYSSMPALKVARLASHAEYAGKKIGTVLMEFAIAMAIDFVAQHVGCRFLVTDSKAKSVSFYEKVGLALLDTEENRARTEPVMFLDLNKLILDQEPGPDEPLPAKKQTEAVRHSATI